MTHYVLSRRAGIVYVGPDWFDVLRTMSLFPGSDGFNMTSMKDMRRYAKMTHLIGVSLKDGKLRYREKERTILPVVAETD